MTLIGMEIDRDGPDITKGYVEKILFYFAILLTFLFSIFYFLSNLRIMATI